MANLLDLDRRSFLMTLDELGIQGARRDDLIRQYRTRSAGLLAPAMEFGAVEPGRVRADVLPMTRPEGMTGWEAIRSGQAEFALPGLLAGLVSGAGAAFDAPRAAMAGLIPASDMASEAAGTAGMVTLGGVGGAGRQAFEYDPRAGTLYSNPVPGLLDEGDIVSARGAPTVDTSYRMQHQPRGPQDDNPVRLDDLTRSTTGESAGYPEDFYSPMGPRYYAPGPSFAGDAFGKANQESYRAISAVRGKPDATVTIYRAVPNDPSITTINQGDFVTLSRTYAELHGLSGYGPKGEDAGKILSQKVKVKDIYWDGNDVNEFGYFPSGSAQQPAPRGLFGEQ